jgi:hypothetical protein
MLDAHTDRPQLDQESNKADMDDETFQKLLGTTVNLRLWAYGKLIGLFTGVLQGRMFSEDNPPLMVTGEYANCISFYRHQIEHGSQETPSGQMLLDIDVSRKK